MKHKFEFVITVKIETEEDNFDNVHDVLCIELNNAFGINNWNIDDGWEVEQETDGLLRGQEIEENPNV